MEVVLGLGFTILILFIAYKVIKLIFRIILAPFKAVGRRQPKEPSFTVEVSYGDGKYERYSGGEKHERNPSKYWVPFGKEAKVGKMVVPGGLIYVGKKLSQADSEYEAEPALLNPSLKVKHGSRGTGEEMPYWPSYRRISPARRGDLLNWLAGARNDPNVDIGIVFIYFYGLERRLLIDPQTVSVPEAEKAEIRLEVSRLLSIYRESGSFQNYARSFLDYTIPGTNDRPVYLSKPPVDEPSWEIPTNVRIAVSQLVRDEKPIPVNWAFAWAWYDPETSIRTPARRCKEEIRKLFEIRYREKFQDGLRIKPNKRRVKIEYNPASSGISHCPPRVFEDLPDVVSLKGPSRKLRDLFEGCTSELDAYSRWLGRHPEEADSLQAKALLPPVLLTEDNIGGAGKQLKALLVDAVGSEVQSVLSPHAILEYWPPSKDGKYRKADAVALSQFLEKMGYGVEPDVRFHGPRLDSVDNAVVFRLRPDSPSSPSREYMTAALTLRLAAAIAVADGVVTEDEQRSLERHMESSDTLVPGDRDRLRAHVEWLLQEKPGVVGLKKRLEELPPSSRSLLGQIMIAVAAADGHIDPEEIKVIKKLYRQLGLEPEEVYSDIHAFTAGAASPAVGPVTVKPAGATKGFKIDRKAAAKVIEGSSGVILDPKLIEAKIKEAGKANALLTEIFIGDDDEEPGVERKVAAPAAARVTGLDEKHAAMLARLGEKEVWDSGEIAEIADELGLMADGALETINDAAWEKVDDPVFEIGESIIVDREVLKELMA